MPPSISPGTYARRRAEFLRRIQTGVAIIPTSPCAVYSNDVEYRYRPDSDFSYLTGFREPGAVAVLIAGDDEKRFVLFVQPRDPERELWTGRRAGVEGAVDCFGADAAHPIGDLDKELTRCLKSTDQAYFPFTRDGKPSESILAIIRKAQADRPRTGSGPVAILDPSPVLHDMRLRKDAEEIAMMREAVRITATAHREAMRNVQPGQSEYEIEALVEGTFRRLGAVGPAYPTIAASGPNATVLHYTENGRRMIGDELMLLDAGAEFGGYNADVTRTFPVKDKFSGPQRDLYSVVLAAQKAAIECVKPGVRYDKPHEQAVRTLTEGFVALGLLKGSVDDLIEREEYRQFYMHRTSHWIGMDVHDVGVYRPDDSPRLLEPGMVLTVEPGAYIAPDAGQAPAPFRGIGIRIEDDVLVTDQGNEVLSASLTKQIDEIEAERSGRR